MNIMSLQRNEIPIENHSTQTKHKRTSTGIETRPGLTPML